MSSSANTPTATPAVPPPVPRQRPRSRYRSLDDPESVREFLRNLGEGVYITTPEGRILDANAAFLEMFGVGSLSEFEGLNAFDLFQDPAQRELEMRLMERDGR